MNCKQYFIELCSLGSNWQYVIIGQIIAWHWIGHKPLSELALANLNRVKQVNTPHLRISASPYGDKCPKLLFMTFLTMFSFHIDVYSEAVKLLDFLELWDV